ncbi:extracellular solute-binding protein [Natronolimnobius sp. AArcel1]|uniref:sugar ABC transporter substrate-binding protein n=1 Tax=Natronolimnobius sp. AArcel1 TaxID=1679093 RepID=UPI0013EC3859|nr:substrate-binding domain-containing protein [Natronolimnobius sp. AArcel1]NGM70727.1 extracellular solute-binding protein [Natronolimnobius sp. AArcel1]
MELSKRTFLKASGATTVAALAGCLGDDDDDGRTFWAGWWDEDHLEDFRPEFESELEEETGQEWELTEYQYDDLQSNVLTGGNTGTPDLLEGVLEHPGDYVAADAIEPLTDHVQDFDHFDGYLDAAIDAFEFQGELWGLPLAGGNGRALVYRTDILAEYGYEDGPPEDLDELVELAGEINANEDMNGLHLTTEHGEVRATQEFLSHVYQRTGNIYEYDGDEWVLQATADDFEIVLDTLYYNLFHGDEPMADDDYRGAGWETNDEGYSMGDHAMIHCGPWIQQDADSSDEQAEVIEENTGIAELPVIDGGERATYMEVSPVMINAHTDDLDASLEALELFTSPEMMQRFEDADPATNAPTHDSLEVEHDLEAFETFEDAFENGVAPAQIQWGEVRTPMYDAIEEVIYDETDPATAAEELEAALSEADVQLEA